VRQPDFGFFDNSGQRRPSQKAGKLVGVDSDSRRNPHRWRTGACERQSAWSTVHKIIITGTSSSALEDVEDDRIRCFRMIENAPASYRWRRGPNVAVGPVPHNAMQFRAIKRQMSVFCFHRHNFLPFCNQNCLPQQLQPLIICRRQRNRLVAKGIDSRTLFGGLHDFTKAGARMGRHRVSSIFRHGGSQGFFRS